MATSIDDNAADENLDKGKVWFISVDYTNGSVIALAVCLREDFTV